MRKLKRLLAASLFVSKNCVTKLWEAACPARVRFLFTQILENQEVASQRICSSHSPVFDIITSPIRAAKTGMVIVVMQLPAGFTRFIALPENRSALAECQEVARLAIGGSSRPLRTGDLVYLHGPAGVGKSCLITALVEDVCSQAPASTTSVVSGNDFPLPWDKNETANAAERFAEASGCDLLVVEDLQHLPNRATETLIHLLDERLHHGLVTVVTASAGPAQLAHRGNPLPERLTNRLSGGLVVAMHPLQIPARRQFLQELARRRGLDLADEVLTWLAESLSGGGRQLEGALHQVEA